MATPAKGKKQKKAKKQTLSLNEFLQDDKGKSAPGASYVLANKPVSWADEMEEQDVDGDDICGGSKIDRALLPTAPRAARGPDFDVSKVPNQPPFTAFLGNLPYDIDIEDIELFFRGLHVSNIRIPQDGGRQKGFGYAEFPDKATLIEALSMQDNLLKNRKIRIDLAGSQGGDRGDDRSRHIDDDGEDKTLGDWRRKDDRPANSDDHPPKEGADSERWGRAGGSDRFGDRDRRDQDRGGFDRSDDRRRFDDRDSGRRSFGTGFGSRDGGGFERRDGGGFERRDGGFERRDGGGFERRDGGGFERRDGGFERRDGGFERRDGGFERRDGGFERRDGGFERRDRDSGWRDDRTENRDRMPERDGDSTRERPKLKLQPRTRPLEENVKVEKPDTGPAAAPKVVNKGERSAAIFGSAKPVNTAAREREIEDKLRRQREDREREESEKENKHSRLSGSAGEWPRTRQDSTSSQDGTSRRERKSSSSSGKGIRTVAPPPGSGSARVRRDSALSDQEDVFDDERSPRSPSSVSSTPPKRDREENSPPTKLVPAPPPKENVWERRKHESTSSQHSQGEVQEGQHNGKDEDRHSQPTEASQKAEPKYVAPGKAPKENAWDKRRQERSPNETTSQPAESHRSKKEKPLPKSIDEMPKYEDTKTKDYSDANKFSYLMTDENDD